MPKPCLPSFFSLSKPDCNRIQVDNKVKQNSIEYREGKKEKEKEKLEKSDKIKDPNYTYVKVTAKGSPSGTATTTMVT